MRLVVVAVLVTVAPAAAEPCDAIPVWRGGKHVDDVCRTDAARRDLTVIDLGDTWTPRVLEGTAYEATYWRLSAEHFAAVPDESLAARDRYLEQFGIEPTFRVIRARLGDVVRHRCHDEVTSADDVLAVQQHLACDGLFLSAPIDGALTWQTNEALATFQRGEMILPTGELDDVTRDALALDSRERDFRSALRVLRERVRSATGLIEDGTAGARPGLVLGRRLDADSAVLAPGQSALPDAAPDLISPATEAAARALGWTDPAATLRFLDAVYASDGATHLVAVRLPARPRYHGEEMALSIEIDRGDVRHDRSEPARRPTLTVYATTRTQRIALVRWPTTIGGWQDEQGDDGVVPQWKDSPVGARNWRDLYVMPRWLPPASIPDQELVRPTDAGGELAREVFGPSYRSAFGLVAFVHHDRDFDDEGIRTHATGNLQSLGRGASHGCHRLLGLMALRLADFVLAHHDAIRRGDEPTTYHRIVHAGARAFDVSVDTLGDRIELVPPIPVVVLPGRVRH